MSVVEVAHVEEILLSNSIEYSRKASTDFVVKVLKACRGYFIFHKSTLSNECQCWRTGIFFVSCFGELPSVMLFGYQFSNKGRDFDSVYKWRADLFSR